jgi:AAA ATPase domain
MPDVESPRLSGEYVPRLLAAQIAGTAQSFFTRPQSVNGVVLFVDIADSTSMTDRVSALGPDGAERLGGFLNAYFRELIGIVAARGGDVVRFDGDAIISFWGFADWPSRAHLLAAQAAEAVRDVRLDWPVEPPKRLRHRIALVTGEFRTLVLFNSSRRRFLVFGGDSLHTIGRIMRNGELGDIILDDGMARLLAPVATTDPVEAAGPAARPATRLNKLDPTAARPLTELDRTDAPAIAAGRQANGFVPRIVLERAALGLSASLAEFRIVSIVYARLADPDLSDQSAIDRLQASFEVVANAADAMGVEIFDVVADEKGVIAQIALGLPPFDSEGNATRAVEVARRIRDALTAQGVACAIGIATGRIFCGDVGNAIRREYVLRGPVMNYGARLMEASDGGVLCDAATVQGAVARFAFSGENRIRIRGRAAPLSVHRLIDARALAQPVSSTSTLHGRGWEFSALLARLDRLHCGTGGLVAINAEAGGGKSRLLAELAAAAQQRGCAVIEAGADAIERMTAYFIFRQVLRQLLAELTEETGPPRSLLGHLLGQALAGTTLLPRAALIEDVMPLGIENPGLAAQVRGAARRDGVADIIVALSSRLAERRPLVLLIDDLQWVDALSADLLLAVSARLPQMLVVTGSRPADPAAAQHGARVIDRAQVSITLPRLEAGATTQMISDLLQARTIPHRLSEFVHEQSEGLPIHIEQLVLSMREQGMIEVADGRARLAAPALATGSVPLKLREIVVSRIDRLRQADQLAVKVASVIGRSFDVATLHEVYPIRAELAALTASAGRLSAAGILTPAGAMFAFCHVIIQETTYDLLSYAQRRPLHRAIAERIEQRHQATLTQHFTELSHHWEHAEEPEKALRYRLLAANLALQRYANHDALMHAERAERMAERSRLQLGAARAAQLAYVRGEAYHGLSRFAESECSFQTFLRLSAIKRPATRARLVVSALQQILLQALHRAGIVPRPSGGQGEERARLFAHLHTRFAEHAYFMRDYLALLHGSLTALNRAESVQSYPEMIEGYGGLAIGLGTAGLHPVARFYRNRCITISKISGKLPEQAFAHLLAGVYSYQAGDWKATRTYCTKGLTLCEQLGDQFRRQSCLVVECFGAIATGDFKQAQAGFDQFGTEADTIDNAPVRAWVLAGSSVLDMLRGRSPDRALRRLEEARDTSLHRAERLLCDGLEAAALMQRGDTEASAFIAKRALEDMQDSVCTMGIAMYSVCAVADVFLALAGPATADSARRADYVWAAERACRTVGRYAAQTRICRPRASLLAGRLALLEGRGRRAQRLFARALAKAERLGMPLEEGECHLALAAVQASDAARKAHAGRGTDIMRRLGANPWRYGGVGSTQVGRSLE